jgi:hypothetical protein
MFFVFLFVVRGWAEGIHSDPHPLCPYLHLAACGLHVSIIRAASHAPAFQLACMHIIDRLMCPDNDATLHIVSCLVNFSTAAQQHSSTAAQQHSSTEAQQHSSTAAQQHSSTAAQQHSSTAAQQHSSTTKWLSMSLPLWSEPISRATSDAMSMNDDWVDWETRMARADRCQAEQTMQIASLLERIQNIEGAGAHARNKLADLDSSVNMLAQCVTSLTADLGKHSS